MPTRADLISYLQRMVLFPKPVQADGGSGSSESFKPHPLAAEQITALMALILDDGSYLLDPDRDADLTYQIVGQIREFGFTSVWKALISGSPQSMFPKSGIFSRMGNAPEGTDLRGQSHQILEMGVSISTTIPSGRANSMEVWLESEGLSDARLQNLVILDIRMSRLEIGEALYTCSKCSQKETIFYQKQTRGADEPMTITVMCTLCNHEWSEE